MGAEGSEACQLAQLPKQTLWALCKLLVTAAVYTTPSMNDPITTVFHELHADVAATLFVLAQISLVTENCCIDTPCRKTPHL